MYLFVKVIILILIVLEYLVMCDMFSLVEFFELGSYVCVKGKVV